MTARPKSILILGAAKSGTTALFYAIRKALVEGLGLQVHGLFEPTKAREIAEYVKAGPDDVPLVKALLGPILRRNDKVLDAFDKRIVIYRDPRDNIVSRLVFMPAHRVSEKDKRDALLELFRQKEGHPDSISILEMLKRIGELLDREGLAENLRTNALLPATMQRESGYYMMPYDDLVTGHFEGLSEYLGIPVSADFQVDEKHSYVVRTKGSGDWRNWFLDEDVKFFAADVAEDYRLLGFDPNLKPNADKQINPATCSEYVAAQFATLEGKRRKQKQARRARGREATAEK